MNENNSIPQDDPTPSTPASDTPTAPSLSDPKDTPEVPQDVAPAEGA